MPTPLEMRERLPQRMAAIGVSANTVCELAGMSPAQLSGFLNGKRPLAIDDVMRLHNSMSDLEQAARVCDGIPLDFKKTELVRGLLHRIKSGCFSVAQDPDRAFGRAQLILSALR